MNIDQFDIPRRKISLPYTDDPRFQWQGVTLWMQVWSPRIGVTVNGQPVNLDGQPLLLLENQEHNMLLNECAWGMFINEIQMGGGIEGLNWIDFGGKLFPKANNLGLFELQKLKIIPPGDSGEAYLLEISVEGRGLARATFADSVGAAKRWYEEWLKRCGMAETIATAIYMKQPMDQIEDSLKFPE